MNKLALILVPVLGLTSCKTFDATTLIAPTTLVVSNEYLKKHPDKTRQILDLAEIIEIAGDASTRILTKEEFLALTYKIETDRAWVSVLSVYIYDIYKNNLRLGDSGERAGVILKQIAQGLRDSVLIIEPNPSK